MVVSCSAFGCTSRFVKGSKITFHSFPKNKDRLQRWVTLMKRQNWTPSGSSAICSEHFRKDFFIVRQDFVPGDRVLLKDTAEPTIINFPPHLTKNEKIRKPPSKRQHHVAFPTCSEMDNTLATSEPDINSLPNSPTKRIRKMSSRISNLKKKINSLRMKVKRRDIKISTMKELLQTLQSKHLVNEEQLAFLQDRFSGVSLELIKNQLKNSVAPNGSKRYSQTIKEFALMLHFYSPRAYEFARRILALPHENSIRKWVASVQGDPGFLIQTMDYVANRICSSKKTGECSLIFDSMSIRKQTVWDGKQKSFKGFVDYGVNEIEGSDTLATEALVFQIVALNDTWKYPVGYFLINKTSAYVLCQLLIDCISLLAERGIIVVATVCDGTYTNQETSRQLGCVLSADKIDPSFPHPCFPEEKIQFLFDACHMIKLMRNLFCEYSVLEVPHLHAKEKVKWEYIEKLVALQSNIGLKLGNRLTSEHVKYHNKKMNVRLAAQVFSTSVADSIDYLRSINNSDFVGSSTTTKFIRFIDSLFDCLNSRNPYGQYGKEPLRLKNKLKWENIFSEANKLLTTMKTSNGKLVCLTRKKTAIIGFLATIKGISNIANNLLARPQQPYKYILSYKFSQDHLELFFSKIRRKGGWNNNPNALQFRSALKSLVLKNDSITSKSANCKMFELETESESLFAFIKSQRRTPVISDDPSMTPDDITPAILLNNFGIVEENVLYYIAGYLLRKIRSRVDCELCSRALYSDGDNCSQMNRAMVLTCKKNRGGLLFASDSVLSIVKACEKSFRIRVIGRSLTDRLVLQKMQNDVVQICLPNQKVFSELIIHDLDAEFLIEDGHRLQLIRKISKEFLEMRMKTYSKFYNSERLRESKVRQKLTKLILFKNQ